MEQTPIYDCQNNSVNIEAFDNNTGHDEWYAVYTIQLGELIAGGVFDWKRPELDWSAAKFDDDQYTRVCEYFIERFRYREISIEPFLEWAQMLKRKLVFEIMPKYQPLYEKIKNDPINPLQNENEYYKNRTISSSYPETILSENSDYITDGHDEEYQKIKEGNFIDLYSDFATRFKGIDEMVLDELESMFISMYSLNMNATW